jgi:enoyl-CoA hydratase/carnithine racemase
MYRENPGRAVFIVGEIGQPLVDRLTPRILELRSESADPITAYIDSLGGSIFHARLILNLLTAPTQDGRSCPVVTVVTGTAASAAADILAAGSYSIAYRHALIHYHGVRTSLGDITHESASTLAESLRRSNEGFALELAGRVLNRFFFVYAQLKSKFAAHREAEKDASDVECLAHCMTDQLSGPTSLLEVALGKHQRLNRLLTYYKDQLAARRAAFVRPAEKEAFLLQCLVAWELRENTEQGWRFDTEGLNAIREDFVLLADFEDGQHMQNLERKIREWGALLLDPELQEDYEALQSNEREQYLLEKTRDKFKAVWHFLVSLCRALQQGENRLTPEEAYWLGLVDEVPGTALPSVREMIEKFRRDEQEAKAKKGDGGKVRSIAASAKKFKGQPKRKIPIAKDSRSTKRPAAKQ